MLRRILVGFLSGLGILLLVIDAKTGFTGAKEGIDLCLATVIPSLFPFFVLTGLLTSVLAGIPAGPLKLIGRFCRLPEGAEALLIIGLLGGYPAGAQIIGQAYRSGIVGKKQARRLIGFCNNPGPAFLFGICGRLFPVRWMVWALWGQLILSAMLTARITETHESCAKTLQAQSVITMPQAVVTALRSTAIVCGWVILFRILIAYLDLYFLYGTNSVWKSLFCGLLELTNGCYMLGEVSTDSARFLLAGLTLTFGGVCVCMQTASVIGDLGTLHYLRGKLIQTCVSMLLSLPLVAGISGILPVPAMVFLFLSIVVMMAIITKSKNSSRNSCPVGV